MGSTPVFKIVSVGGRTGPDEVVGAKGGITVDCRKDGTRALNGEKVAVSANTAPGTLTATRPVLYCTP
ncbi:hypothetical protein [Serratia fonticola]